MKRILLFVAFSLLVIPAFSQISIGVTGGYSLAKYKSDQIVYPGSKITNSFISTWHAGVIAETKIAGHFYFQPQLLFSKKGDKYVYTYDATKAYYSNVVHVSYIELPLNVVYKFKGWYVGAGPYVARGLKATSDIYSSFVEQSDGSFHENYAKGNIEIKNNPTVLEDDITVYYRPMNYGVNFLGGYELKNGLFINVNYSMGLTDNNERKGYGRYNRTVGVNVGYFLGRGKK